MTTPDASVTIGAPSMMTKGKLTPAWLTQNSIRRMHYQAHAQHVRAWLDVAMWQIKADRVQPVQTPVKVDIHVKRTSTRRLDCDAIAPTAKVCIDALVRSGVIPEDGPKHVVEVTYHAETGRADVDWLTIELRTVNP